jgi:zinc/manganese transport system ATP-binding protein
MIHLQNICFCYRDEVALQDVTLTIPPHSLMAIVGGNGAGKTTLLNILSGLTKPSRGCFVISPGANVAYLPQQSRLDRDFPLQVRDVVAMGFWQRNGLFRRLSAEQGDTIDEALDTVGLEGLGGRNLNTLSGGQLQRVLFARLMVQNGDILLLDEPFAALDEPTIEALMELLQTWHAQGKSIITVLHDLNLVRRYFPQAALLARRLVAFGPTPDVLTPHHLTQAAFMRL